MLTLGSLLDDLGLDLAAGQRRSEQPIRWVHISELADPTPWLSGGELLLSTGISVPEEAGQRRLIELLDERGLAGLGIGTGFTHERIPEAMLDEASKREFPLFEVPYAMPFIALTERAFTRLVNDQYAVLERSIQIHERLESLVIEERGMSEIIGGVAAGIGGSAYLIDGGGQTLAAHAARHGAPSERELAAAVREMQRRAADGRVAPFAPPGKTMAEHAIAVPVPARGSAAPGAWLLAVRAQASLTELERLVAREAVLVIALELMRERVVRETERRLAGDVLAAALSGRLDPSELRSRLRPFGIGEQAAVAIFELPDADAAAPSVEAMLEAEGVAGLVARAPDGSVPEAAAKAMLCAVVDCESSDCVEVARSVRSKLSGEVPQVRAGASRPTPIQDLRRAFHEARCALEATSFTNGDGPEVATSDDLGAFTLLLALQDDDALRLYSESLLAPIEAEERDYANELIRSLEAYITNNGQWERAARELYCHRHTLRYRIRRIEELTGRDLSRAHDRIEMWLALRARELVG